MVFSGEDFTTRLMNDMDPPLLDLVKTKVNSFIKWDLVRFLRENPNTADTAENIRVAYRRLGTPVVVVRSSAPGEDSAQRSHAGLHESLVGIEGEDALLDAVRIVWASLWSDAAILYKRELNMDPGESGMAVVVQELVTISPSGVGFGIDPRSPAKDRQIVEAVPGLCEDLVSGNVDPDRWIMKRSSGEIVEWRAGQRGDARGEPLLDGPDLETLHRTLKRLEETFGWFPDVEWTGKAQAITLLQARPVTGPNVSGDDEREWYLSLRPGKARLNELCTRVTDELIPALEAEGERLAHYALSAAYAAWARATGNMEPAFFAGEPAE